MIWIALNLYIKWGQPDMLMILSLPTHKHRIFLHLFKSSLNSFIIVLYFLHVVSEHILLYLHLRISLFGAIVNDTTFFISNYNCLLPYTLWPCYNHLSAQEVLFVLLFICLILYFVIFVSFFNSFELPILTIMSPANKENYIFSFPICIYFISFS